MRDRGMVGSFLFFWSIRAGQYCDLYTLWFNDERDLRCYGRSKMDIVAATPILKSITTELFGDIVIDKVIGNLPLIGIPANIIAAKAMTWRLGILFGIGALHSSRSFTMGSRPFM